MRAVVLFVLCCSALFVASFEVEKASGYTLLKTSNASALYRVETKFYADAPIEMIVLKGSRWQIGYDYGKILGREIVNNYAHFFQNVFKKLWEEEGIMLFLEYEWNNYLSKQFPAEFLEELDGINRGAEDAGYPGVAILLKQMLTLANFPGKPEDNIYWLLYNQLTDNEHINPALYQSLNKIMEASKQVRFMQCSFFAVWGNRTIDGSMYTMRNLDWQPDSGIADHKLVTIYKIDGKIPYATLGFAGLIGSLTGMSSAGLTVHEAGNDSKRVTFRGTSWTMRLRLIMENAKNLAQALAIWQATNNTMGMNHMIASASDVASDKPAAAMETMKGYTAYFYGDDVRETELKYTDPKTNVTTVLGAPLKQAVWRTNHGYDPIIVGNETHVTKPSSDSEQRYMILHNSFAYYANANIKMREYEAINITSILGDKGNDWFHCPDKAIGGNVLSVTYNPAASRLFVAFEHGTGETWRPACCGTYVQMELAPYFN